MMKTRQLFKLHLFSLAALFSMALAAVSCANEDIVQNGKGGDNGKGFATFVAGEPTQTRTSIDYATGNFYWEEGDKIYVKDDDGTWQVSNAVDAAHAHSASFMFKVPGKFENSATYKVYYPGKNGSNNQVNIPATQTQTEPNTSKHSGESGDCGTADATGTLGGKVFNFQLEHQAAILVFQPYTSNEVLKGCYLTKVEVSSDNDITDTYTLNPTTGELTGTGNGKMINLTTKDPVVGSTNEKGFSLNTTSASVATNGAYMFIKPGTHILKVRYWIKSYTENIEGAITKILPSFNYDKNTYYDLTANLDTRDYSGRNYYMWDAQQNYWYGHEWDSTNPWQPSVKNQHNSNYPLNKIVDPDRWYNDTYPGPGIRNDAQTVLFKTLPNANEMAWYVMKGDPRWDDDELWTSMGHLYKGGIWLLKKNEIANKNGKNLVDLVNAAPDGTDLRTTYAQQLNSSFQTGLPLVSEMKDYFFLRVPGVYSDGTLRAISTTGGGYWSSSADPSRSDYAYVLGLMNGFMSVDHAKSSYGNMAQPLE